MKMWSKEVLRANVSQSMEYATLYCQKELLQRRYHNLLGSRYGVFRWGLETNQVQDSGKEDMLSQGL